jgi:hypothetical protein
MIEQASKQGISRMKEFGTDVKFIFPDGGNLLHHFCKDQQVREDQNRMYLK